jgi:hypothetical protein
VFFSHDSGSTWTAVNTGLSNLSEYALAISGPTIFAGSHGSGVWTRPLSEMGIVAGINNLSINNANVNAYPNPFRDSATLTIKGNTGTGKMDLMIYNLFGKEAKRISLQSKTLQTVTIDRVNLPNGVYFYKLIEDNKIIATGKFVTE